MSVVLSRTLARLGITSLTPTPVSLVLMGLKSPRMLSGASGLGSQMSRWLGPPWRKMKMKFLAEPKPARLAASAGAAPAPRASSWSRLARLRPSSPAPPTRSSSRRETPSHVAPGCPGIESMVRSPSSLLVALLDCGHQVVQFFDSEHPNVAHGRREPRERPGEVNRGQHAGDRVDPLVAEVHAALLPD